MVDRDVQSEETVREGPDTMEPAHESPTEWCGGNPEQGVEQGTRVIIGTCRDEPLLAALMPAIFGRPTRNTWYRLHRRAVAVSDSTLAPSRVRVRVRVRQTRHREALGIQFVVSYGLQ